MEQLNLSAAVREALQPVIEADIAQIKGWTAEQMEAALKVHGERQGSTSEASALELQALFAEADADGDGLLNLPEY